jgi:hypothetical protein
VATANLRAVHKEFKPYVKSAIKRGWTLSSTGKNHLCLTSPDGGRKVLFSRTFSEPRGLLNFKRDLERVGAIA